MMCFNELFDDVLFEDMLIKRCVI